MEPTLPHLWGRELCWMGSRPLRPELERQYSRFGSFPGLEARGAAFQEPWPEAGPKLGAVPKISFQRPPWSLGCSPQPGPLPHHHSLPSLPPVFRTPERLYCYQRSLEDWGGDEEQLGFILLFTWGDGGGSDGAGCGGAVGCRGVKSHGPWGRKNGGREGSTKRWGAHFTEAGCVALQEIPERPYVQGPQT